MDFPYDIGAPQTPTSNVFPYAANINPGVFQLNGDQIPQNNYLLQETQKRVATEVVDEPNSKKKKSKNKDKEVDEDGDKKRVAKACVFCQRSHMSCDSGTLS